MRLAHLYLGRAVLLKSGMIPTPSANATSTQKGCLNMQPAAPLRFLPFLVSAGVVSLAWAALSSAPAATIHVDARRGRDTSPGTLQQPLKTLGRVAEIVNGRSGAGPTIVRLAPGVYTLSEAAVLKPNRPFTEQERLIVEAAVLPDDPRWRPDSMPTILSIEDPHAPDKAQEPTQSYGLKIKTSHATVRGLKFLGSPIPNNYYCSLECVGDRLEDILVTQCLFVGDRDTLNIYCAAITDGDRFVVDHCVFRGCHGCAVLWDGGHGHVGKGNAMRYCLVNDARIAGVWTCDTDEDFDFHHNVVAGGEYFWMRKRGKPKTYRLRNCVVVGNSHYSGYGVEMGPTGPTGPEVSYKEEDLVKEGEIQWERSRTARRYLHPAEGSLGSELGAGLFKEPVAEPERP